MAHQARKQSLSGEQARQVNSDARNHLPNGVCAGEGRDAGRPADPVTVGQGRESRM